MMAKGSEGAEVTRLVAALPDLFSSPYYLLHPPHTLHRLAFYCPLNKEQQMSVHCSAGVLLVSTVYLKQTLSIMYLFIH